MSKNTCAAIEKLSESLQPSEPGQQTNALTAYLQGLATGLIENASRKDDQGTDVNIVHSSYCAMIALVQHSCAQSMPVIQQMLMPFLSMLEQTVSNPDVDSVRNTDTQDMIAGLLQVILVSVGNTVDTATGEKIVQLLVTMFQSLKKVTENGLIAYSGLC